MKKGPTEHAVQLDQLYHALWGRPLFKEQPMKCTRQEKDFGLKEYIDCGMSYREDEMLKDSTPNDTGFIYICKECQAVSRKNEARCGDCGHWSPDVDLAYPGVQSTGQLYREDESPMCETCIQNWFDGQGPD